MSSAELHSDIRVLRWLVVALCLVFTSIIVASYLDRQWTDLLIFKVDDGWCRPPNQGIGRHCFGDFGLAYYRGDFNNAFQHFYVPENYVVTNTPFSILIFSLFRLVSYNIALVIYLGIGLISIWATSFWGARRLSPLNRTVAIVVGGVLTYGTLSALDRGNHVLWIVFPSVMYVDSVISKNWRRATLCLVVVSALKFWGLIFIIPMLIAKKFRLSLFATLASLATYLIPLACFHGGLVKNLKTMLEVNSRSDIARLTMPYNSSLNGLANRVVCALQRQTWCNTNDLSARFPLERLVPLLAASIIVLLTIRLCKRYQFQPEVFGPALMLLPILGIPDAAPYNSVFFVGYLALYLRYRDETERSLASKSERFIGQLRDFGLVVSLMPFAFRLTTTSVLASSNGGSNPVLRLQSWFVPILWTGYLILRALVGDETKKRSREEVV